MGGVALILFIKSTTAQKYEGLVSRNFILTLFLRSRFYHRTQNRGFSLFLFVCVRVSQVQRYRGLPVIDPENFQYVDISLTFLDSQGVFLLPQAAESILDPIPGLFRDILGPIKAVHQIFTGIFGRVDATETFFMGDEKIKVKGKIMAPFFPDDL